MQSLLPQLTTILLLLHLVLGCCLHHAHACKWDRDERAAAGVDGCERHSHGVVATAARHECDEPPVGIKRTGHHAQECAGADCTFIAGRPRLVSHVEEASHLSSLAVHALSRSAAAFRVARCGSCADPELARCSLPRTHLALQVLQL